MADRIAAVAFELPRPKVVAARDEPGTTGGVHPRVPVSTIVSLAFSCNARYCAESRTTPPPMVHAVT